MIKINKIITYCSNIFKINNAKNLINNIKNFIKKKENKKINIGLCISIKMITEKKIKEILKTDIKIKSINGFVYQNFHSKLIKEKIYYPDWSSKKRIFFTKKIIKKFENTKKKISISSIPITYKNWNKNKYLCFIIKKSIINLKKINEIIIKYNKYLHIDLEPEPGCQIECFKTLNIFYKTIKNEKKLKKIKICYDICHMSVIFDKQEKILKLLNINKINIGKTQISCSLKFIISKNTKVIKRIIKTLFFLKKSNFLHQICLKGKNNIKEFIKIEDMIKVILINLNKEIKLHCHIPIYMKKFNNLYTTYKETKKITSIISKKNKNFEIETYTYNTLFNNFNSKKSMKKEILLTINYIK